MTSAPTTRARSDRSRSTTVGDATSAASGTPGDTRALARTMLRFERVTKIYQMGVNEVRALDGVDLSIDEGELVAIMGPSGSGKTTMMNILGCLDVPTEGRYHLDGIDVAARTDNELAAIRNRKIGFVFQSFNLIPRTNALRNVELPLIYAGVRDRAARAVRALEQVGLADRRKHMPNELSGGQQQRVAIARALVSDPAMLLADEPTGNLDSASSMEIMKLLVALNDAGRTVVLITHEEDIARFAKRVVRLRDGRIVSDQLQQVRTDTSVARRPRQLPADGNDLLSRV
jgi:putative ABC transport system ATP-binding protein